MYPASNFCAWLSEDGKSVPGSFRTGHNVFTNFGKQWIRDLCFWALLGDSTQTPGPSNKDIPLDERRLRWIGVGSGSQAEDSDVQRLHTPLPITAGPNVYIKTINGGLVWPTPCSQKYTATFSGGDFGGTVDISEAAVYPDFDDGGGPLLDPTDISNVPVAYKTFAPLNKTLAQTLTIVWEFRF